MRESLDKLADLESKQNQTRELVTENNISFGSHPAGCYGVIDVS